ncbi:MAG: FAD-dependent oxidoreductase [Anaeromyxobacteraceae bacterium]
MGKTVVCACEDVTLSEVRRAFARGHRDLESVKRYTGFGTGPCQGKSCLDAVVAELLRLGATPAEISPFTARPPVDPVTFGTLAALDPATLPLGEGVPVPVRPPPPAPAPSGPLPERASVVIVGGGILGLSLAHALAERGVQGVVVLERSYLNAGASGRNGGGVRAQWSTPTMVRLGLRSLRLFRSFAGETGVNVWFRRGGYLFLAPDEAQVKRLERNLEVQRAQGMRTRILTPDEACEVVPELDRSRFTAASWNPDDGVVFPWPFLWGYAAAAEARGAVVRTFTPVTGLEITDGLVRAVETPAGRIRCDTVVNACGAWSPEVARLAGVSLPNRPTRHEILVSGPLKPWLGPLVSALGTGLYFSQSQRGEIVGGMGDPAEPAGISHGSSLRFLARFSRALTEYVPATAALPVMRQWAGNYDVTPDNNPILGAAGPENFLQLSGFVGHGFMMAPAVAEIMADWMTGREKDEILERFTLDRFEKGTAVREDFIIG